MKKILIITTNEDICNIIQQIIGEENIIHRKDFKDKLSYINIKNYDLVIIDFDRQRIRNGDFGVIFDIRCKTQIPILAILEESKVRDKIQILSMKIMDYIERPIDIN